VEAVNVRSQTELTKALRDRVERQDVSLFDQIPALLAVDDRRSLLALHDACAKVHGTFSYLEIGSHLGGSLQALVRDPACNAIASIDARPDWQPDQGGVDIAYPGNSSARMLDLLDHLPEASVGKIRTFDASTTQLSPVDLGLTPNLCFIDGEHTDEAALRDARFCRAAVRGCGCIAFHDAAIVYRGIAQFLQELDAEAVAYSAYLLPATVFVIEFPQAELRDVESVTSLILENYRGYLYSLQWNDRYREFFNHWLFREPRRLHRRLLKRRLERWEARATASKLSQASRPSERESH
jgi:Methyltransferase domain